MAAAEDAAYVRKRVIYSGHVQGVFFRATSADLARGYDVVGFVRNLRDGTVELVAEGPADQVEAYLQAVAGHFARNITRTTAEDLPVRRSESRFEIRY